MKEEQKYKEPGLADLVVSQATATPTAKASRLKSQSLMAKTQIDNYSVESLQDDIAAYVSMYMDTQRETREPMGLAEGESLKPVIYEEYQASLKYPDKAVNLKNDSAFMSRLSAMQEKYPGLTEAEVFKVIEGESTYRPQAKSKAGAVGLFQMMPKTLGELGFTSNEVLNMAPAEQLSVYEQYLDRWGYDGSTGLGILQAAPAYRDASPDTVIYKKGSKEWEMNRGWRERGDGDITKRSIENYYGRFK